MTKIRSAIIASALLAAAALTGTTGANALPVGNSASSVADRAINQALVHQVQRRRGGVRRGRAIRRGGVRRGRSRRGLSRGRRNTALGIAAGAAILGGIIGAARNAEEEKRRRAEERYYDDRATQVRRGGNDVEYCMRRFRSYNPRTGMYKGFDGRFHPCP